MPVFKIHHITKYEYDRPVRESANEIKIYPYNSPQQETLSHEITITGHPDILIFNDYWNNKTGVFTLLHLHKELIVESKLVLQTTGFAEANINFNGNMDEFRTEIDGDMKMIELTEPSIIKNQVAIDDIIQQIKQGINSVATIAQNCSEYIYKNFKYTKGITNIETTVDEILDQKGGVCQDFAHLMLQVLRTLKIPSRYVSGYICPSEKGSRGEGATHAWVELYIPSYGWAGIDPTNNLWVTNNHVKLAIGKNFYDCSPIKGTFKGPAQQKLSVFVSIVYEDGHKFEEVNNVNLVEYEADLEELNHDGFAAQQQ